MMKYFPIVFFQSGRLLTFLFIFCVVGGHWGVMQLATWSQMASTSSSSLIDAVLGSPCEDCLTILQGNQEEKQDPQSPANAKAALLAAEVQRPWTGFTPRLLFVLDGEAGKYPGIALPPAHGPPRAC